jgi:hypothetical protein
MGLTNENEHGEGRIHNGADACLHCLFWDAINEYHEKAVLRDGNGYLLYDTRIILGHMGDVMAELLASLPDRNERRRFRKLFDDYVRQKTVEYVANGNHPEVRVFREH